MCGEVYFGIWGRSTIQTYEDQRLMTMFAKVVHSPVDVVAKNIEAVRELILADETYR